MKRVFVEALGSVVTVDDAVPEPAGNQAVVRLLAAGVCGSDTHAVAGEHPLLPPPYYPGHEAVGVVQQSAPDGSGPEEGTRVVLKPNLPCGECVNCVAGRTNACQTLRWIGCDPAGDFPGAMAELFLAPTTNLYQVPAGVSDGQAALVECLATPVHAARIAGDLTGARVLVQGAGTIGVLALIAARHAGATRVVVSDLEPDKRDRATRLGADAAVDPRSEAFGEEVRDAAGGHIDVIFDCVANERSAAQWTSVIRRAGTVSIVGVPPRDYALPMPLIQDWELRVQGSAAYTERDVEAAMAMAHEIPAEEIISARYPLTDASRAFAEAAEHTSGKILITPDTA